MQAGSKNTPPLPVGIQMITIGSFGRLSAVYDFEQR